MDKNKKSRKRFYVNVGTDTSPKWAKVGRGFTAFRESSNPRLYKRRYITDPADTVSVVGFSPVIEFELDLLYEDAAVRAVRASLDCERAGGVVDILSVSHGTSAADGGYMACRRKFRIAASDYEGSVATLKGRLDSAEDGTYGTFYKSSGVFVADGGVSV